MDLLFFWSICIIVVGSFGVISNLAQVMFIFRKKKRRSLFDMTILSLSAADLLASTMFIMHGLRKLFTQQGEPVSNVILRFAWTGCYFSTSSSVLHIIFIAIQRVMIIHFPLKCKRWFTKTRIFVTLLIIWLGSAAFASPSSVKLYPSQAMSWVIFASGTIIVAAYAVVCVEMKRKIERQETAANNLARHSASGKSSNKVVIFHSFAIMLTFLLCTFPYGVARFFSHKSVVYVICDIIFAVNPFLDPVLYFFLAKCRQKGALYISSSNTHHGKSSTTMSSDLRMSSLSLAQRSRIKRFDTLPK